MKLSGKVAIVTGSGKGIGRATAIALAKEGAIVVVNALHLETAESTVNEICSLGGNATAIVADVTKSDQVNAMVNEIIRSFGRVDILINNAGGSARNQSSLFQDSVEETWDKIISLNLKSVFICTKAVISQMLKQKNGKIINISSDAGVVGVWGLVDYSAAKAGVIGFTRSLAKELASKNIYVNAIAPAQIATAVFKKGAKALNPHLEECTRRIRECITMGRQGTPEEVANTVVFLASEDSSFINGQVICVDGGRTIGL